MKLKDVLRVKQETYNLKNDITPKSITKPIINILDINLTNNKIEKYDIYTVLI